MSALRKRTNGRPAAGTTSPRHELARGVVPAVSADTLPAYQPQLCPPTDSAQRALAELSTNREAGALQRHMEKARSHLNASAAEMCEAARDCRADADRLAAAAARRTAPLPEHRQASLARHVAHANSLTASAAELGPHMEAAVRRLIDWQAALEDESAVLAQLKDSVALEARAAGPSQQRLAPRPHVSQDADDTKQDDITEEEPRTSLSDAFRDARAAKSREYAALSAEAKYVTNNDYVAFKRSWHEGVHGPDLPLPDASRWFTADGQPVLGPRPVAGRPGGAEYANGAQADAASENDEGIEADDDDDDIVVAGEKLSFKCPLSLKEMEEPYANRKCKHVFDKAAIVEFIGALSVVNCPQTGCSQPLSLSDFYLDEAMLRRIARSKREEQRRRRFEDEDEDEDEENNHAVVADSVLSGVGGQDSHRSSMAAKRERLSTHNGPEA